MSSHNRGARLVGRRPGAAARWATCAARRVRSVAAVASVSRAESRTRVGIRSRLERERHGYAIVNDSAHDYSILHYYVSRDAQAQQLDERRASS